MKNTNKAKTYPVIISLMISGFIVFLACSAYQAGGLGSKVTDADYYSKGLKYNTTQVERRAAEVLGWHLETKLDGRKLKFHLTDRDGNDVDRAVGQLYLALPNHAENISLLLKELSAGHYVVSLDDTLTGDIQGRLELERKGARLNRQLLLNL